MSRRRHIMVWTAAAVALLVMTVAYTWPLAASPGTVLPGDQRDPYLNAALLDHVFRSLATLRWSGLWETPYFHGHPHSLAFSESFLGTAWYGIPAWLLTSSPVALHNVFLLLGTWFTALAGTVLGYVLTRSVLAGMACGAVHGFGVFHLAHANHVQMHHGWGVALALAGVAWVARGDRFQSAGWVLAAGMLGLQVLSCSYLGLYGMAAVLPAVVCVLAVRRGTLAQDARAILLACVLGAVLLVPTMSHYVEVARGYGFERRIEEVRGFSAPQGAAGTVPAGLRFMPAGARVSHGNEDILWPGRVAPVLGVLGLAWAAITWMRRRQEEQARLDAAAATLCVATAGWCTWLSTGLGAGDGPTWQSAYSWLYHLVPGFNGLRVPTRFHALTLLAWGAAASVALGMVMRRWPRAGRVVGVLGVAACAADAWPAAYPLRPLPDAGDMGPALADLARSDNPGPIVELPYRLTWRGAQNDINTVRHGRRTVNGYSGVEPPLAVALRYLLPSWPRGRADEVVRQLGVRALVVHRGPPRGEPEERMRFLEEALTTGAVAARFNAPQGAWLDVTPDEPGPLRDLAPAWKSVRACQAGPRADGAPTLARVDMEVPHAVVSPLVRHRVTVKGAASDGWLHVTPLGLGRTWVGALRLTGGEAVVEGPSGPPVAVINADARGPAQNVMVRTELEPGLRAGQASWLRILVEPNAGVVEAPRDGIPNSGVEIRLDTPGLPGDPRPRVMPLRTDGAAGCPGVAEGVFELPPGPGNGQLVVSVRPRGGGPPLATASIPLEVAP